MCNVTPMTPLWLARVASPSVKLDLLGQNQQCLLCSLPALVQMRETKFSRSCGRQFDCMMKLQTTEEKLKVWSTGFRV